MEATERVAGGEENDLGEEGEKSFFTKIKIGRASCRERVSSPV